MASNLLARALENAGWDVRQPVFEKRVFRLAVFINCLIAAFFIYQYGIKAQYPLASLTGLVIAVWVIAFFFVLSICWFLLFVVLDLLAFQRVVTLEEVLPDYLQLTAANLRAGMTTDHALWYAVRPKFGVLADEIGIVAKEVMTGDDLPIALRRFAKKYNSPVLHRAVSLLIEGMNAGGDLAEVVNNVGVNIQDTRILNKEMSANILTYVIFISSAVMFAAPMLLALSQQLLTTLTSITASIDIPVGTSVGAFALNKISIQPFEFQRFAFIMLTISSFFSGMIVAIIQKGTVQGGIKYIPMFIVTSLVVFFLASRFFGYMLGGIVG